MTDDSPVDPDEVEGTIYVDADGSFPIPAPFAKRSTIRTPGHTTVMYKHSRRTYEDAVNAWLRPGEREWYVQFERHDDEEDRTIYRLAPRGDFPADGPVGEDNPVGK